MILDMHTYRQLKDSLRPIRGPIKSSHLDQGLARGFGFPDYHALKTTLEKQAPDASGQLMKLNFDVTGFLNRMGQLGYMPGPDVNDPHASLRHVAVTALSIAEPGTFLEIMKETGVSGPVIRLDVTDDNWKRQVAGYRAALTRHWGPGTSGYVETGSGNPWVCWTITPPMRWKRGAQIEITNTMIKVQQGREFGHILDERDAGRIRAIQAETGESPDAFFSRILTKLRPCFPGFNDTDIDPVDDILFTDEGLMVRCSFDNRRAVDGLGCSVFFEKIPFQRQKTAA